MKLFGKGGFEPLSSVASFAGAWIETRTYPVSPGEALVASFAGAWIETIPDVA